MLFQYHIRVLLLMCIKYHKGASNKYLGQRCSDKYNCLWMSHAVFFSCRWALQWFGRAHLQRERSDAHVCQVSLHMPPTSRCRTGVQNCTESNAVSFHRPHGRHSAAKTVTSTYSNERAHGCGLFSPSVSCFYRLRSP